MKKAGIIFLLMVGFIYMSNLACAQTFKSSDILGIWLNEDKDAHVKIYQEGEYYFGKIVWMLNPIDTLTGKPKLDKENSNPELAKRPIDGLILLSDFVWEADDDEWDDGSIYDPKNGKTYSCYMRLDSINHLRIRGYIGISLLGRTTYWSRVLKE